MNHSSKFLAIGLSVVLAVGAMAPVAAEENEDLDIDPASVQQYEAWSERVEVDALNMAGIDLLKQAEDGKEYSEYSVMLGGQVAMSTAEADNEENAQWLTCKFRIDNPHKSTGAGGAIYKTRVKCSSKGVNTNVKLRVRGLLSLYPAASKSSKPGKAQSRATSDANITVKANSPSWSTPVYTPHTGKNGGKGKGFWNATSTWQVTSHSSLKGKRTGSGSRTVFSDIK